MAKGIEDISKRLKKAAGDDDDDQPTASEALADELQVQETNELITTINQFEGSVVSAVLKRRGPTDVDFKYVGEMPADELREGGEEHIKKVYGGGDYRVMLRDKDKKHLRQFTLRIDPRFKGWLDDPARTAPNGDSHEAPLVAAINKIGEGSKGALTSDVLVQFLNLQAAKSAELAQMQRESSQQMLTMLVQAQQSQTALIVKLFEQKATPPPSTDGLMAHLMPVLIEMIRQRTSPLDSIKTMAAMREFFESSKEEDSPLGDIMKLIGPAAAAFFASRGMLPPPDASAVAQPGQDHGPGAPQLLAGSHTPPARPAAAVTQAAAPGIPLPPGARAQAPAGAQVGDIGPVSGLPGQGRPELTSDDLMANPPLFTRLLARKFLPTLVMAAAKDFDPEIYFDIVKSNATEGQMAALRDILAKDDWIAQLWDSHPDVLAHREWFEDLRDVFLNGPQPTDEKGE